MKDEFRYPTVKGWTDQEVEDFRAEMSRLSSVEAGVDLVVQTFARRIVEHIIKAALEGGMEPGGPI